MTDDLKKPDEQTSQAEAGGVVDIETLRAQVEARRQEEVEKYGDAGGDGGGTAEIDSQFVRDCLWANELGDGELFKRLHRDRFVFNKSMDCWLVWTGHHWEVDKMDQALAAVENVVDAYSKECARIAAEKKDLDEKDPVRDRLAKLQDALNKRISGLRSTRRRKNCLVMAHTTDQPLAIQGNEIDEKPWLLPCPNGVVDLRTGVARPGQPEDYLVKACTVDWPDEGVDAKCPIFEKTLLEILSDDEKMAHFLQRLIGFSLVGEVHQSIIAVWTGQGRNGKSMLVKLFSSALGPLAGPVRSEMLLDQTRNASSAGPTPDIMALRGRRLCFASETDDGCRISPSRVKWLTGNDRLTGRNPHDKYEQEFEPTHTLFLLTNHKPHAPADDFAFWERVLLIPFELSFVNRPPVKENEREADPDLINKLFDELPAILGWMVRGCLYWQREGLAPPGKVLSATAEYQRDEDRLADFFDDTCIEDPDENSTAADLYSVFEIWWKINVSKNVPKQKWFGKHAKNKFEPRKVGGLVKYFGVRLQTHIRECLDMYARSKDDSQLFDAIKKGPKQDQQEEII